MRGQDGVHVKNAHLISLYHRVCKLLYYKIKPVFVFDGGVPLLKQQTIVSSIVFLMWRFLRISEILMSKIHFGNDKLINWYNIIIQITNIYTL